MKKVKRFIIDVVGRDIKRNDYAKVVAHQVVDVRTNNELNDRVVDLVKTTCTARQVRPNMLGVRVNEIGII